MMELDRKIAETLRAVLLEELTCIAGLRHLDPGILSRVTAGSAITGASFLSSPTADSLDLCVAYRMTTGRRTWCVDLVRGRTGHIYGEEDGEFDPTNPTAVEELLDRVRAFVRAQSSTMVSLLSGSDLEEFPQGAS